MLTVRVQFDVRVASRLHTGVGLLAGRGTRDLGKECAGGQIDERYGTAAKCFGAAIDVEAIGMSRSGGVAAERRDGGDGIDGGRHGGGGQMVKCQPSAGEGQLALINNTNVPFNRGKGGSGQEECRSPRIAGGRGQKVGMTPAPRRDEPKRD